MKKVFAWLCIAATMAAMPVSAFAAEVDTETETAVIEQQAEARPGCQFGKRFERLSFDGEKKFSAMPEGFEKPEMGEFMKKGFGKFKKPDGSFEMNKEAMQEKLAELLAEGKITQEQYDAITSGEMKPEIKGEKKFAALPEGFQKPENGEFMAKGFAKFKQADGSFKMNREAMQEKLAELLADGKISQEKYDAITSGEAKPMFQGAKLGGFKK